LINVTDILIKKYADLLTPVITDYPVFIDKAIEDIALGANAYVVITASGNSDNSTMQSDDTLTSIQVAIYSRSNTDNNGDAVAAIATIVYNTIKPGPVNTLALSGVQVLTTEFGSEQNPAPFDTGSQLFINRFITFNHKIFHQ
jgi:hypothetical protein